jgi:hypothetical protein
LPDKTLVELRTEVVTGGASITADFSGIGATTSTITLKLAGSVVATASGNSGAVFRAGLPTSQIIEEDLFGWIFNPTAGAETSTIRRLYAGPVQLSAAILGGGSFVADELWFQADDATLVQETIEDCRIIVMEDRWDIVGATITPVFQPWVTVVGGLQGRAGIPLLSGAPQLVPGGVVTLSLVNALPSSLGVLFVSLASNPLPFKGGTLATVPFLLNVVLFTGASGSIALPLAVPSVPIPRARWCTSSTRSSIPAHRRACR